MRNLKPDAKPTSIERSQGILTAMQDEMRQQVLGEMRSAGQLATLAGRSATEIRRDLDLWAADGRILSVRHKGVDCFALFALNPAEGYRPYPAVADAIRILSAVLNRDNAWGLASWFIGLNGFLDDLRPADLLTSDPEWVIEAAQDEVNDAKHPHG